MTEERTIRPEDEIEVVGNMIDQIEGLAMDEEAIRASDPARAMRYRETLYTVCAAARAKIEEIRVELRTRARAAA